MLGSSKLCNPGYSSRLFMGLFTLLKRFNYLDALPKQCCLQLYGAILCHIFDSHILPVLLGEPKSYYRW